MALKIGNVPPKGKVTLTIQMLQHLEVSLNMFWRLSVQSHVWPRYVNDSKGIIGSTVANFTWSFKVDLHCARKCVHWSSPSHKLELINHSQDSTEMQLVLPQSQKPTGDFIFLYTVERFEEPGLLFGRTDTGSCCLLSFIPHFSGLGLSDAEHMAATGEDYLP